MQSSKQKGLLNHPRFHFQKLRVVKTHKKIYGSNNCWWFINSYPGDPTSLRLSLMGDLASAQKYCPATETVCPHITNIFSSRHDFHIPCSMNTLSPLSFLQMSTAITWVHFYGFPLFFFPASETAWGKSQIHWCNSQDAHQDRNHQAQL